MKLDDGRRPAGGTDPYIRDTREVVSFATPTWLGSSEGGKFRELAHKTNDSMDKIEHAESQTGVVVTATHANISKAAHAYRPAAGRLTTSSKRRFSPLTRVSTQLSAGLLVANLRARGLAPR